MPHKKNRWKIIWKKMSRAALKPALVVLALVVSATLLASGVYYAGYTEGLQQTRNIVIENVTNTDPPDSLGLETDFSIFWEVWGTLKEKHPDIGSIDDSKLIYGAINGLTEALDDPNTDFFNPEDSQKFNEDIEGRFSGIGAEIAIRDGKLTIVTPLKGSPAEKAGVKAGDVITDIDGESTLGLTITEAVKAIRGEAGTTVTLTILREGVIGKKEITIVRDDIEIPAVDAEVLEDNILYLQIHNFSANTPSLLLKAILNSVFADPKGIILDLRNNPGGFLEVAVRVAGWFLESDELVVIEKFASGSEQPFYAKGRGVLKDIPLVILVNEGSASASEILAGAIRFHRGATLVGEQTFGKGTVQQIQYLSDESTLKVTIANWLLPDGTLIEGNGLKPDIVVETAEDDVLNGTDPQLSKAIEVIRDKIR